MEYDPLSGKPQFHGPYTDLWLFQPWGDTELCIEHSQLETRPWLRGKKLHNNYLLLWIIIKRQNTDVYSDIFLFKTLTLKIFSIFRLRQKWKCDHLLCVLDNFSGFSIRREYPKSSWKVQTWFALWFVITSDLRNSYIYVCIYKGRNLGVLFSFSTLEFHCLNSLSN